MADVAQKIAAAKAAAAERGRSFSYGIRLHVIVRETAREAWAAADDLIRFVDDDAIASAQKVFARYDSVGQQRMARLHGGRRDKLEIAPNLWAGVGLVRGGAGTALVGDPDEVAARMREYMETRHRPLHPVGLPASRGMLPVRGTRLPQAAAPRDDRHRPRPGPQRRDRSGR